MAGHPGCRAYFGVLWLDGVSPGQTQQATHFGLSGQQFDWWKSEGYKKSQGLCYVAQLQETSGKLQSECAGCTSDWTKRFRWIVFERIDTKDKRSSTSEHMLMNADPTAGRPNNHSVSSYSASDPNSRVEREVTVVSTGAAVYKTTDPIRAPSDRDAQLFYYSAEKDKSSKDASAQVVRNDRAALQAAAEFILKNVKR